MWSEDIEELDRLIDLLRLQTARLEGLLSADSGNQAEGLMAASAILNSRLAELRDRRSLEISRRRDKASAELKRLGYSGPPIIPTLPRPSTCSDDVPSKLSHP